jgi:hypothetical protein
MVVSMMSVQTAHAKSLDMAIGAAIGMLDHSHIAFARSSFNNQQNMQGG